MVVLGVVMELWVIWHEYRDDMEAWALTFFGVLRRPARPSAFKVGVEVASVLLITFGIVGELWVGIEITSINGVLRGESAELRSKNAELRSKSDQLVAILRKDAERLSKDAEDERTARVKLEEQIQPRWYTVAEQERIIAACSPPKFAGKLVAIRTIPYDVEGAVFASALAEFLHNKTKLFLRTEGIGNPFMQNLPMFLDVHVAGPADERELVHVLTKALAGSRVKVGDAGGFSAPVTTIFIGAKRLYPAGGLKMSHNTPSAGARKE